MSLSLISGDSWGSGAGVTTATGLGEGDGDGAGVGLATIPATVAGALGEPPPQAARMPRAPRAAYAATVRVINTILLARNMRLSHSRTLTSSSAHVLSASLRPRDLLPPRRDTPLHARRNRDRGGGVRDRPGAPHHPQPSQVALGRRG